jgi:hypothetical protein
MATFGSWLKDQSKRPEGDPVRAFAYWWDREGDSRVHSPSGIEKRLNTMPGGEDWRPAYLAALHDYQGERIAETAARHEAEGRHLNAVPDPQPPSDQGEQLQFDNGGFLPPGTAAYGPAAEGELVAPASPAGEALAAMPPESELPAGYRDEPGQLDRIERKLDRLTAFLIEVHGIGAYRAVTEGTAAVPAADPGEAGIDPSAPPAGRMSPSEALGATTADLMSRSRYGSQEAELTDAQRREVTWTGLWHSADFTEDSDAAGA